MQQTEIQANDGVSLSYRTLGKGPAVMLLHGLSQWSQMWITNGVAQHLSKRFTVILPDRRGHGYSGRPTRPEDYGLRMAEDVFDVLDAEDHGTVHLAGFSQGSEVAWRAALERPERVRSIVLMASGWPGPALNGALDRYAEILDWLPQAIKEREDWLTPDPDLPALAAIVTSMRALIDVPASDMARLKLPALGIAGSDDPERETIECLAGLLPDFSFEVLSETDHLGTWRHPRLPRLIESFLTDIEGT